MTQLSRLAMVLGRRFSVGEAFSGLAILLLGIGWVALGGIADGGVGGASIASTQPPAATAPLFETVSGEAGQPLATATLLPTATAQALAVEATPTIESPGVESAPAIASTATATVVSTATATPPPLEPEARDHLWLGRPIEPPGVSAVERFYPYGSTAQGLYEVHHGVEFENPSGTPVVAVADGVVVWAGDDISRIFGPQTDFYGNLVVLQLERQYAGKDVFVLYGHLSTVAVQEGQRVQRGALLGEVGMSGVAIGPHLHFEVRVGGLSYGDTRNPELWLVPAGGTGVLAGRLADSAGAPLGEQRVLLRARGDARATWREFTAYAMHDQGVNSDEAWGENFVFGDLPAGAYEVEFPTREGVLHRDVTITDGEVTFLSVVLP